MEALNQKLAVSYERIVKQSAITSSHRRSCDWEGPFQPPSASKIAHQGAVSLMSYDNNMVLFHSLDDRRFAAQNGAPSDM